MPGNNRSIGGRGQEQGGPNMGNDIGRDISREAQADDSRIPIVKHQDEQDELGEDYLVNEEVEEADVEDKEMEEAEVEDGEENEDDEEGYDAEDREV